MKSGHTPPSHCVVAIRGSRPAHAGSRAAEVARASMIFRTARAEQPRTASFAERGTPGSTSDRRDAAHEDGGNPALELVPTLHDAGIDGIGSGIPASRVDSVAMVRQPGLPRCGVAGAFGMAGERRVPASRFAPGDPACIGTVSMRLVHDFRCGLTRGRIMRTVEPAGSPSGCETHAMGTHHRFACRSCGALPDVDRVVGEPPRVSSTDASGFVIDEAAVTFWGICPVCQTTSKPFEKESAR
jgi:Fur family transcriptional regulator, stress-responsive regulator